MRNNLTYPAPKRQGEFLAPRWLLPLGKAWDKALSVLALWWKRAANRRALRGLMDHDRRFFSDIGISRATMYNETCKWFWQA